ncbi:hypothetical protein CRV24_008946 [Beauveria bassiana]|nr:hypothetical protein CRV24_008946 [Beauveria bassiana]
MAARKAPYTVDSRFVTLSATFFIQLGQNFVISCQPCFLFRYRFPCLLFLRHDSFHFFPPTTMLLLYGPLDVSRHSRGASIHPPGRGRRTNEQEAKKEEERNSASTPTPSHLFCGVRHLAALVSGLA